jgi:hypothetical protein
MSTEMKTGRVAETAVNSFPRGRWTLQANPFKSSYKPELRQPAQGELSLDGVKPVRNDLSDSDLELIPRKTPRFVEAAAGSALAPSPAGEARRPSLWERVKARLLRRGAK